MTGLPLLLFVLNCLVSCDRIEIEDSEAVGISNIISNLISTFPRSVLTALPNELFASFINCLTLLTCSFGRSAALEEVVSTAFVPQQATIRLNRVAEVYECQTRCSLFYIYIYREICSVVADILLYLIEN